MSLTLKYVSTSCVEVLANQRIFAGANFFFEVVQSERVILHMACHLSSCDSLRCFAGVTEEDGWEVHDGAGVALSLSLPLSECNRKTHPHFPHVSSIKARG